MVTGEGVTVRQITSLDQPIVSAMILDWASEGGWSHLPGPAREAPEGVGVPWRLGEHQGWLQPDWDSWIDVPAWAFLVADRDGDIVGFARGRVRSVTGLLLSALPDGGELFELTELYVAPAHRGAGVGSDLLRTMLAAAADRGLERATLVSATPSPDAVMRFYRRHGFEPWWIEFVRNIDPLPPRRSGPARPAPPAPLSSARTGRGTATKT